MSTFTQTSNQMLRDILLSCGMLSSLLYIALNIIVPFYYPGYDIASQTVSELSAIGAPSRSLWVSLCIPYSILVVSFGLGIWLSAGGQRKLRILGLLVFAFGFSGFFWPPMHQREVLAAGGRTSTDTMHIFFAVVTVFLMILIIGFGAAAFGKWFRYFSIATLAILLFFGVLTGAKGSAVAANLPTPWLGIWERINIGCYMLWVIVLSILLIAKSNNR